MSDERTLEDDLKEAWDAHVQDAPETDAIEPAAEPAVEPVEPVEPAASPERDEHGRFKAKEAAEPAEASAQPEATEPVEPSEPQPDPYGLAPQHVGASLKAKWKDLDPDIRKDIVEREKDVHKGFTKFDEERVLGKQVREVVKPYENFIRQLGAEPVQAFDYLLKTDYALRTADPASRKAMFLKAAKDYGVDLSDAATTNDNPQPQQFVDPRLETLEQKINRLEAERNNDIAARRDEEQRSINAQIESFASDPAHPYYERVKPIMAALLQNGQAGSLEEAYDRAVFADPETRALHLAATREAEDRKRAAEASEKARKARQASPSVTGAPGSSVPTSPASGPSSSLEDDIRNAWSAVTGRA